MDFSGYSTEIRKLTDDIPIKAMTDPEKGKVLCDELIEKGEKMQDAKLLGFGYYHLANIYFVLNDYKQFSKYLQIGVEYQKESAQWSILARSYNLMGISAADQGNITVALDQYLQGVKIGKTYECEYEVAMIYNNMGQLYMRLEEFEQAIYYFSKSEQLLLKFTENQRARQNLIMIYIIMGECYIQLEKTAGAEASERQMTKWMQEEELDHTDWVLIYGFRARLCHAKGMEEACEENILKAMECMDSFPIFLEIWEDVFSFGDFLLNLKKYEEVWQLFEKLEKWLEDMQVMNMKAEFLRLKIRYYKGLTRRKEYLEACAELYECREIQHKENLVMLRRAAELRFSLEEAEGKEETLRKETTLLREKAERDALTELPNRYRLKAFAEELYEKAYRERKNFGIEILDVDYFKQYNDGYGHQKGDECLKTIAKVLRQFTEKEKNVFCARYGGDEFVILYYGKTSEEILHEAVILRQEILKQKILHQYSPETHVITISQGIHNTIPKERKSVWDYLHSADGALYQAKQCEKNSVCMKYEKEDELVDTIVLVSRRKDDI